MVTAEFAAMLPAVVLVLALVVGAAQMLIMQEQATHAAVAGARVAARGETDAKVRAAVAQAGPTGSTARIVTSGDFVTVNVVADAPSVLGWVLPSVSAEATSVREASEDTDSSSEQP